MIELSQERQIVRGSPRARRVWGVLLSLAFMLGGCCGNGPSHKCNFTPPGGSQDAAVDGPEMPCGQDEVCKLPDVCCVTKVPLLARCIPLNRFQSEGCEMLELPCSTPAQCPAGLVCCVAFAPPGVTCRPAVRCPTAGGENYLACGSDAECPNQLPGSCVDVGQTETGQVLRVCI